MGVQVASLFGVLELVDKFTPGLKAAQKNTDEFGKGVGGAIEKVTALSSAMAAVPGAAFLVGAVKVAADFDKSMTNVGAVLGKTKDQMGSLNQEVLNIGKNSVAGPQKAADAFYDIVGGVADASTHMAILNAAIATSEAGAADLGATTSGLISVMNAYKFSADKASFASDVLTTVVGKGVGSMDQMVAAISPISGLAASAGIKFNDMGSAIAFMTTKGQTASQAATQYKAAIVALLNPNAQMAAAIRKTGAASGSALIQQYGLVGAMNKLKASVGGSQDAMAKMFGSVEALQAVTALATDDFGEFSESFQSSMNGATDAARRIQLGSFSAQFEIFKNNLIGVAIAAGNVLLPALTGLFSIFNGLMGLINQFDPNLLGLVAAFTALGVVVPAILPLFGMLAGALAPLLAPIALLVGAFTAVKLAWEADFGGIRTAITGFWADIQPAIAQIKSGIDTFMNIMNNKQTVDPYSGMVAEVSFGDRLKQAFETAWPIVQPAITSLIDKAVTLIGTLIPNVISALVGLGSSIASAIGAQIATINWGQAISDLWNNGLALGKKIIDGIGQGLTNIVSAVQGFLGSINLVDIQAQAGDLLRKALNFGQGILNNIGAGLSNLVSSVQGWLAGINLVDIQAQAGEFLRKALNFGTGVLNNIVTGLGNIVSSIGAWLGSINLVDIQAQAGEFLRKALNFGAGVINNIVSGLSTLANDIRTRLETAFSGVDLMAEASKLLSQALRFGEGLLNNIASGISNFANDIKAKLEAQFSGVDIGAAAKKIFDDAIKFGGDLLKNIGDGIKNTTVDIAGKITDWLNGINWEQVGKDVVKGAANIAKSIIDALFPKDSGGIADNLASSVEKASDDGKLKTAGEKLGKALMKAIGDVLTGIGEMIVGKLMEEMSKSTPDWLLGLLGTNKTQMSMAGQMLQNGTNAKSGSGTQQAPVQSPPAQPAKPLNLDIVPNREKGTATNPLVVQPIAPPGGQPQGAQAGQQGAAAQPAAPVNLAPAVAPVAQQAAGQAGTTVAVGGQNPVEPIVQAAVAWLESTGRTLLTAAFKSVMDAGAAAFQVAGMAAIPAGVMTPLNLAVMWVNTVGRAGVVTTFAALATSANAALKGVGSSMVSSVADALIRIATMIGNLPNGVGAQLAAGIRAAAASGRARGGAISSGLYLVGEHGPELIQLGAGQSGHVYENSLVRGAKGAGAGGTGNGGGITLYNPVFQGVQDPQSLLDQLEQVAGRYNQTIMRPI